MGEVIDTVVVGGGQSGLATARALQDVGIQPVILEAGERATGSWAHYYDSLILFSPARYSSLPGMKFPGDDPGRYPHRDEVVAYLAQYADYLGVDIRTHHQVVKVLPNRWGFGVHIADGRMLQARSVVAASGGFGHPHWPRMREIEGYSGKVLHAADYRNPEPFAGRRIVVVGAGNSAVQIATELAGYAEVSLATRSPVRFFPQRLLGRDVHFWLAASGVDRMPVGRWVKNHLSTQPVLDDGRYRKALRRGLLDRRPIFVEANGPLLTWPDGRREHIDAVLLATGYRPKLDFLRAMGALNGMGQPMHAGGISQTHEGLAYVGLEWQRSFASATLRGVGRDARQVAERLGAWLAAPPIRKANR